MAELAVFAQRLLRFDPAAVIRLRDGQAWGLLPWGVLVAIDCPQADSDRLLPPDGQWRVTLPPPSARVVEVIPASGIRDTALAAASTLRATRGKVGERILRDTLLDHSAITGTSDVDGMPFVVPQRLVQALVRMYLVGSGNVDVLVAGPWTALRTELGTAWYRPQSQLSLTPIRP